MGRRKIDYTGMRFGDWIAKESLNKKGKGGNYFWILKCTMCEREKIVEGSNIRHIKKCRCDTKKPRPRTKISWHSMKQRCLNLNHTSFNRYGGRGIMICERWMVFENFLADMGERPEGLTLERIDNDGHYEPINCKWATYLEQRKNRT